MQFRIAGILLMISGWLLMPAAVVMLSGLAARTGFVAAGLGVEVLGFLFIARTHAAARKVKL